MAGNKKSGGMPPPAKTPPLEGDFRPGLHGPGSAGSAGPSGDRASLLFLDPARMRKMDEFLPKEAVLVLNELKPAFGMEESAEDLAVEVRALTYDEVCGCAAIRDGGLDAAVKTLEHLVRQGGYAEAAEQLAAITGAGTAKTPAARYNLEVVRRGTKKPQLSADMIHRIGTHYPLTIQRWANRILDLTGMGPEIKKNLSGS